MNMCMFKSSWLCDANVYVMYMICRSEIESIVVMPDVIDTQYIVIADVSNNPVFLIFCRILPRTGPYFIEDAHSHETVQAALWCLATPADPLPSLPFGGRDAKVHKRPGRFKPFVS